MILCCRYVRAKHAYSGERWPLKSDDFYPYADFPHAYWTGDRRITFVVLRL